MVFSCRFLSLVTPVDLVSYGLILPVRCSPNVICLLANFLSARMMSYSVSHLCIRRISHLSPKIYAIFKPFLLSTVFILIYIYAFSERNSTISRSPVDNLHSMIDVNSIPRANQRLCNLCLLTMGLSYPRLHQTNLQPVFSNPCCETFWCRWNNHYFFTHRFLLPISVRCFPNILSVLSQNDFHYLHQSLPIVSRVTVIPFWFA